MNLENFEPVELTDEKVKVIWDYIGEGYNGDYNRFDKNDVPLLRLDVYLKDDFDEWHKKESVCTNFRATTAFNEKYKSLIYILEYISKGLEIGKTLKELVADVSYISENNMSDFAA